VVDTRFNVTMSKADLSLVIRPGAGNLLDFTNEGDPGRNLQHAEALAANLELTPDWQTAYDALSWEALEPATGISREALIKRRSIPGRQVLGNHHHGQTTRTFPFARHLADLVHRDGVDAKSDSGCTLSKREFRFQLRQ